MQDTCHYDKNKQFKHSKNCNCDEQYQLQKELFEPEIQGIENVY